jgi:hypothetical protein
MSRRAFEFSEAYLGSFEPTEWVRPSLKYGVGRGWNPKRRRFGVGIPVFENERILAGSDDWSALVLD